MSAIVSCRTAALGGHHPACEDCGHTHIANVSATMSSKRQVDDSEVCNDVTAMLGELGAELDHSHGGRLQIHLNGQALTLTHPNHSLTPDQVRQVRKLLESAGIDPAAYPA